MDEAEALYGAQLQLGISRNDIPKLISPLREYYDNAICDRVEQLLFERSRKYRGCFGIH